MPAIQPARLRQQAALLSEHFERPAAFVRSLHHLLDFYADRTHRPGQAGEPPPLLAAYNVKPPVLRQILYELVSLADDQPEVGLALCDALWEQAYLEFRLLAAGLLGQIPPDPPEALLHRVEAWARSVSDARLVGIILNTSLARLRQENPPGLVRQVERWLTESEIFFQKLGLQALLPLLEDQRFENFPVFYRLIYPLARVAPTSLRPELLDVVGALARRSPRETAYFLRQTMETPKSPDTAWIIRRSLGNFPPEVQESLRLAVREFNRPGEKN